jgi:protein gp37
LGGVAHESTFDYDFHHIRWLILGAMSGPGAKKYAPDPRWVSDAVARCRERNIPVFMKNSLRPYWEGELIQEWPEGTA